MALFEWSDALSVGVADMDVQHKKLFSIINELYDAMREARGKEVLGDVLKRLLQYTQTHFTDEEKRMQLANYAGLDEQKRQHAAFIAKINETASAHAEGKAAVTGDLLNFLRDWLKNHIQVIDKKYGPVLGQR